MAWGAGAQRRGGRLAAGGVVLASWRRAGRGFTLHRISGSSRHLLLASCPPRTGAVPVPARRQQHRDFGGRYRGPPGAWLPGWVRCWLGGRREASSRRRTGSLPACRRCTGAPCGHPRSFTCSHTPPSRAQELEKSGGAVDQLRGLNDNPVVRPGARAGRPCSRLATQAHLSDLDEQAACTQPGRLHAAQPARCSACTPLPPPARRADPASAGGLGWRGA